MKKVVSLAGVFVVGLLCSPAAAAVTGVEGAAVTLACNAVVAPVTCADPLLVIPPPATTGEGGAFSFDNLPAAPWLLTVTYTDSNPALSKSSQLGFIVEETAPARLAGRVTTLDGADVSLQVNAVITAAGTGSIVLAPGFPKTQPAWNSNWIRSRGQVHVRLAGTGLEGLDKVTLARSGSLDPEDSEETTLIRLDPVSGVYHAIFSKSAAFDALVPDDAVRGDVVSVDVVLTKGVVIETFPDAFSFRIVGGKKPHPKH